MPAEQRGDARRTGAQGVICTLELLARGEVLALGSNALEVIGVVLEAVDFVEFRFMI